MNIRNFRPGSTVEISSSTTSARGTLSASPVRNKDVLMTNQTTVWAFFKFGDSTVTATTGSTPLPPSGYAIFDAGQHTHVAVILASGTGTVCATSGEGS